MRSSCKSLCTLGAQKWASCATTQSGVFHQCSGLVATSVESLPSTSGRVESNVLAQRLLFRSYSAAPGPARTAEATKPAAAAQSASPAAAAAPPSTSSTAAPSSAPYYSGLAARYPDPAHVPEALMQRLRNELFGRPVRPRETTGRRALARPLQGRQLADWYFMPPADIPGFHNEEREYDASKALNKRHKKEEAAEEAAPAKGKKKK